MKVKILIMAALLIAANGLFAQNFNPPQTKAEDTKYTLHDFTISDPYMWLEDKSNDDVKKWTHEQHDATNKYFEATYSDIPGLRGELTAYIDRDIKGPIRLVADKKFFSIKKKGDKQAKLYTIIKGKEKLLFDPVTIDESGKTAMSGVRYSFDGKMAAILCQTAGAEIYTAYIISTKNGKHLFDPISGLRGFNWAKDGEHVYLTVGTKEMLENQIPLRTYLHKLGDDRENDKFIVAPEDAKNFASAYDSKYSNYSFISKGDFYSSTILIKKTGSEGDYKEIYSSSQYKASVHSLGEKLYIYTNDNAMNFKLMVADAANPEFKNWKELYGEKETVLKTYAVTDKYLWIVDQKDVLRRLLKYTLDGKLIEEIKLPELGNVGSLSYHRESGTFLVSISSFTSPLRIYQLNEDSHEWNVYYEQESPIDTKDIEAKIEFYTSKDGARVPIFIIHKKGMKLDGTNPTLLYGYGGFNHGISPSYIGTQASFINRGGVYAIAGIRGGDEFGEKWHLDGMMHNKQNTFDDFIAAAEFLISENYTNPQKLVVRGGSNGGLLIGAVITQRPDLFKAAVCAVPLLDMIRYHKFLIARYWIPEYGDPEKAEDFRYILTYSPFHNVRMGINHPTTLVIAGENDTRVAPLHAKKFVAALQNNPGQYNPIMLHMDFGSGHGTGKSTEQQVDELEFNWKFIMNELGMN